MAISLEHWTHVCPAATLNSSLRSAQLYSFRGISLRLPPASSRCRHDSKRRGEIALQFEAAEVRQSGWNQSMMRDDERFPDPAQVDPADTKFRDSGSEAKMAALPILALSSVYTQPLLRSDEFDHQKRSIRATRHHDCQLELTCCQDLYFHLLQIPQNLSKRTCNLIQVVKGPQETIEAIRRPHCARNYKNFLHRSISPRLTIPCLFMRGGTSRGTFFLKEHLPEQREALNKVLLRVMGSPDRSQIDGLGGATFVTSKVAILSAATEPGVDVDYTFAQVMVDRSYVDWEPTCGNILAGVGPAAIEMGLVGKIGNPLTPVTIRATNTGSLVEAVVRTPNYSVTYDGDAVIDGVPGTAAPIVLNFMDVVGSKTGGKLLPTGQVRDLIDGVEVTCIDVAMPIVIAKASSFGKTGYETMEELDGDDKFLRKMEAIRVIAGMKMGLGNVSGRVIPKFVIVAKPRDKDEGNITARYFTPLTTHPSMAVTGAICVGCCSILRGSVADEVSVKSSIGRNQNRVVIEHPSGRIQVSLDSEQSAAGTAKMTVHRAGIMRTARLIFEGSVHIKTEGLEGLRFHQSFEGLERYRHYHLQLQKDFRKLYRFKGSGKDLDLKWDGDELEDLPVDELLPSVNAAWGA